MGLGEEVGGGQGQVCGQFPELLLTVYQAGSVLLLAWGCGRHWLGPPGVGPGPYSRDGSKDGTAVCRHREDQGDVLGRGYPGPTEAG